MMIATLEDVNDFDFIISEALRIHTELASDNFREFYEKEYSGDLGSFGMTINAPHELIKDNQNIPKRQINLSYLSNEKFYTIASRFIKSNRLGMLVTLDEFVRNIKRCLYIHIFIDDGEDGKNGYTKILTKAYKITKAEMECENFYFPILAHGLGQDTISIGRSEIISAERMYSLIGDDLTDDQLSMASNFCSAHKYPYQHFLKIPVSKRSQKSRERIGKSVAGFIVGILQIFSEHYNISHDFLSISTNPYPNYDGFFFTKKPKIGFSYNYTSRGRITWSDKFWKKFVIDYSSDLGIILSQLIELAIEPKEKSIIADRLIDAIYLFSSAQQDKDESSRIVKLATALERLVSLSSEKKDESTTKNFVSRVSSLVSVYYPHDRDWSEISKEMYVIRSNITHGAWSLYRGVEPLYASKYSKLTSRAILSACVGFYKRDLTSDNNDRLVKEFYDVLERATKKN